MCHQLINADGLPRIILISNIHDQMVNTCKISCLHLKNNIHYKTKNFDHYLLHMRLFNITAVNIVAGLLLD